MPRSAETRVYDLTSFRFAEMTECGRAIRELGAGETSLEGVAKRLVEFFRGSFAERPVSPAGNGPTVRSACVLARCFVTVPFGELPGDLQSVARELLDGDPGAATKCLTLLASAGDLKDWNSRHQSRGHRALPLLSERALQRTPMIAQLVSQFGLDVDAFLTSDRRLVLDADERTFNVFYVEDAVGSPYIPAQSDFVLPFGVRSVVGFGGLLSSDELFAVVLFARCVIPRETALLFRTIALSAKIALLPFAGGQRFA
jgi:hypothetical protein